MSGEGEPQSEIFQNKEDLENSTEDPTENQTETPAETPVESLTESPTEAKDEEVPPSESATSKTRTGSRTQASETQASTGGQDAGDAGDAGETQVEKPQEEEDVKETDETKQQETYDDEPDETIAERLWGLTEMFPEPVRNFCGTVADYTVSGIKTFYQFSCNASWIFFTSSMILFAPVIFETERAQMEEMQRTQQKQVLLGPGSAISSTAGGSSPALPPMTR